MGIIRKGAWWAPFCLAVLLCAAAIGAWADEFEGRVVWVYDGDTLKVDLGGETLKVRVYGIDAPEKTQPYSGAALKYCMDLAKNRTVRLKVVDRDKYGRLVALVALPDGRDLASEMIRAGFAWHYKFFSDDPELARLEEQARREKRGLWADPGPVAPWEYKIGKR